MLLATTSLMASQIKDQDAILSIIGEGEAESYAGKVALARTIINRGTLKGVYGLKAPRVVRKLYSAKTYQDAKRAWEYAKTTKDTSWRATGWGNADDVKKFKQTKWWKNCVIVAQVGRHFFYKDRRAS